MRNAVIDEESNSIITASHRSFPKDHVVVGKWEFSPWKRQPVEYAKKKRQSRAGFSIFISQYGNGLIDIQGKRNLAQGFQSTLISTV